jgi:TRAP-type mannitol/chloroaromatic compound transport system permease small subunit
MKEFFEILGEIETGRLVLYAIIAVVIIGLTLNGIAEIVREFRRK